jgi:hypothetical protein
MAATATTLDVRDALLRLAVVYEELAAGGWRAEERRERKTGDVPLR